MLFECENETPFKETESIVREVEVALSFNELIAESAEKVQTRLALYDFG
jgi:hypothetical protein